jgi:hypothetical protein
MEFCIECRDLPIITTWSISITGIQLEEIQEESRVMKASNIANKIELVHMAG